MNIMNVRTLSMMLVMVCMMIMTHGMDAEIMQPTTVAMDEVDDDVVFKHDSQPSEQMIRTMIDVAGPSLLQEFAAVVERTGEKPKPMTMGQCLAACKKRAGGKTDVDEYTSCSKNCQKMSGPFKVKECFKLCEAKKIKDTEPCTKFKQRKILASAWFTYKGKKVAADPEKKLPVTQKAIKKTAKYMKLYREAKKAARKHTGWERLVKPAPPEKCDKAFKSGLKTSIRKCLSYLRRIKDTVGQGGKRINKKKRAEKKAKRKKKIEEEAKKLADQRAAEKKKREEEAKKEAERAAAEAKKKKDDAAKAKKEEFRKMLKDKKRCEPFARMFKVQQMPHRSRRKRHHGLHAQSWHEYTFCFWLKPLTDHRPCYWSNLFHIGRGNRNRYPGMWLYPCKNKLHIRSGTQRSWNTGCDITNLQDMPAFKWTHVCFSHATTGQMLIHVNGNQKYKCKANGAPAHHKGRLKMNNRGWRHRWGRRWGGWFEDYVWFSDPWHHAGHAAMAHMQMFGAVLSTEDVKKLMENQKHP